MSKDKNTVNINGSGNNIGAISQGAGSSASGTVNSGSSTTGNDASVILFEDLQARIETIEDSFEQEQVQSAVNGLKDELNKNEEASEEILEKRLNAIKLLMNDVFEVVVTTIANPQAGFALVARKVAKKAMDK